MANGTASGVIDWTTLTFYIGCGLLGYALGLGHGHELITTAIALLGSSLFIAIVASLPKK